MSNQPVKRPELYRYNDASSGQVWYYHKAEADTVFAELEAENRLLEKLLAEYTNPPLRTRQIIDRLFWWCGRSE